MELTHFKRRRDLSLSPSAPRVTNSEAIRNAVDLHHRIAEGGGLMDLKKATMDANSSASTFRSAYIRRNRFSISEESLLLLLAVLIFCFSQVLMFQKVFLREDNLLLFVAVVRCLRTYGIISSDF
mmetsp:Transcript_9414/g.20868  ORF Transcript_9414/g.20868 Transcript_9414/m.20868 type:complete len:125 (-) Transcript_9414:14-388(-)